MTEFFVDTSALVKFYVNEVGSAWVRSWANRQSGNIIVISQLTSVELVAALARRQRDKMINLADFTALRGAFLADRDKFYLGVDLEEIVLIRGRNLVVKHPIRTLDALQLACALESIHALGIQPTFISADTRLLAAAAAEGLITDDPNAHP